MNRQNRAPIATALESVNRSRIVPFDVPGHKRGRGNAELTTFLGERCLALDMNSMKPLDNLCHPISVIREAEELAAEAFTASAAFFMVGGTTSSVQAMILSTCPPGSKMILPRNVHRSVINALVLCGGMPIYVNPQLDNRLGIPLGMCVADVETAILANPDAKAVFVNNPTYYGVCSALTDIVKVAHKHGIKVLVDEAHGTHFYFGDNMPTTAMAAGADMASVSMHKSGGSLTQSSILLCGSAMNADYVRQIINLTQTTSGSYLLLSSLDLSRKNLALNGKSLFAQVSAMVDYARTEINKIGDYYAFGGELVNGDSVAAFDPTKLAVNTLNIGRAGIEVYDILRDEYDIQIEFGDMGNMLAYVSVGDRMRDIERLIGALAEIRRRFRKSRSGMILQEYIAPQPIVSPQSAFYAECVSRSLQDAVGGVSAESVMCYPPGIPILAPGERVTQDIINYIVYAKEKGCNLLGCEDINVERINILVNGG